MQDTHSYWHSVLAKNANRESGRTPCSRVYKNAMFFDRSGLASIEEQIPERSV